MSLDRMVFAPNAFDNKDAVIIQEDDGVIDANFLDLTKTTNTIAVSLNPATGGLGFSSDGEIYYAALILSRKVNNVWQRSTQYLAQVNFDDHTNNETAIASYGAAASITDDAEYLNQADEGESAGGVSGAYMNVSKKVGSDDAQIVTVYAGTPAAGNIAAASGTIVNIGAQAYAPSSMRIVTVEIDRPDGSYAAHGSKSVNYQVAITAETAGNWKVATLYSDGTRAVYTITLSVRS